MSQSRDNQGFGSRALGPGNQERHSFAAVIWSLLLYIKVVSLKFDKSNTFKPLRPDLWFLRAVSQHRPVHIVAQGSALDVKSNSIEYFLQVFAFSTWEKEYKIVFDPRYLLLNFRRSESKVRWWESR